MIEARPTTDIPADVLRCLRDWLRDQKTGSIELHYHDGKITRIKENWSRPVTDLVDYPNAS